MIGYLPPIIPPRRREADLIVRVEPATTGSQRREFLYFPRHLYRGDSRWIPPLAAARRDALRPARNPFLQGGDLGAFLGVALNLGLGDDTVGVLAAWPAPGTLDFEDARTRWGCWGLFEATNVEELAERLFYEAENWLFEHTPGIAGLRGPCSLEPLAAPGLLTDGFDAKPVALLPYNPPYYPEMVEQQGYEPGATWRAYALDLPARTMGARPAAPVARETWATIARAYAGREQDTVDAPDLTPGLVDWLDHLAGGSGFTFSRSWQAAAGRAFRRAIAAVREDAAEGAAACFGVPDTRAALRLSGGRWFLPGRLLYEIGLRRARRLRVFPASAPPGWPNERLAGLYATVAQAAAEAGYLQMIIAPVADDDERTQAALSAAGAHATQQFTIYEKAL